MVLVIAALHDSGHVQVKLARNLFKLEVVECPISNLKYKADEKYYANVLDELIEKITASSAKNIIILIDYNCLFSGQNFSSVSTIIPSLFKMLKQKDYIDYDIRFVLVGSGGSKPEDPKNTETSLENAIKLLKIEYPNQIFNKMIDVMNAEGFLSLPIPVRSSSETTVSSTRRVLELLPRSVTGPALISPTDLRSSPEVSQSRAETPIELRSTPTDLRSLSSDFCPEIPSHEVCLESIPYSISRP